MRAPAPTLLLPTLLLAIPAAAHAGRAQYAPPVPTGAASIACLVQDLGR